MEELRELILAHLEELHGTGLSDERYQLYVDTVYQCDTVDKLIELAALELQLEAHEFFLQLVEQLHEFEDEGVDPYASREELEFHNSDGFGDEDAEVENEFFPDDDEMDDGFGDEPQGINTPSKVSFGEPANADIFSGFDEHESNHDDEIDPSVLAMQKALLGGGDDMSDPSYFDIDALLTKAGSVTTEITLGAQPPAQEYNDELADLLSAYEDEESDEIEFDPISEPVQPTKVDGFGQPVSFGQPVGFGQPAQPSGFNRPAQPVPTQGFGQPIRPTPQTAPRTAPQTAPQQGQRPAPAGVAMNNAKNVFAGFSKRKPSK